MTELDFLDQVHANPHNVAMLRILAELGLKQCYLTAGCLFQTVWNAKAGKPLNWGIKDYDVFYFDDTDLSWEAEDRVIQHVAALTADLPIEVEVRNQARVHLWYEARFGPGYPRLESAQDGMSRYPVSCTCVGIDPVTNTVFAPFGLEDMAAGLMRMNPLNARPDLFKQKAESYRDRWPWLRVVE